MFDQLYETEQVWNTLQQPRCPVYMPSACMLLLSALDNGWKIFTQELVPSWDQTGLIYLITLKRPSGMHTQQLILPKNSIVENLIHEYSFPG